MQYYEYFSTKNIIFASNAFRVLCISLFVYELIWAYRNRKRIATVNQVLSNVFTGVVVALLANLGVRYIFFDHVWTPIAQASPLYGFWKNSIFAFIALLVAMDFTFYVAHRLAHKIPFIWIFHAPHHTDDMLNISSGFRASFTCYTVLLFSPAAFLGAPPVIYWAALNFCVLYPEWLHAQCFPRMKYVEWLFVTPSCHRIHHGTNEIYKNKNFGLIFTIFDRLFGTFEPESEQPLYYVKNLSTQNVFDLQIVGLATYMKLSRKRLSKLGGLVSGYRTKKNAAEPSSAA